LRGFILHTQLVKEEDLVVTILTKHKVLRLYRFYGARHSIINIGFLIDFEIEKTNVKIDRLRNIHHIGYHFIMDREKMLIFQNFIKLMYGHLFDVDEIDNFYFYLLEEIIQNFDKNPKRVLVEAYIKLLKFEGRLSELECFLCEKEIKNRVNLVRGYLCACEKCIPQKGFNIYKIKSLFNGNSIYLSDEEINKLYKILCLGI
jgi:recombinational DNA repair protein (RecF pathway)